MPSKLEYIGEDGWEFGFGIEPGSDGGLLDIAENGEEQLYLLKCEADDSATLLYRLKEGAYTWLSNGSFKLHQDTLPEAVLRRNTPPYETSVYESEKRRRAIQITHQ